MKARRSGRPSSLVHRSRPFIEAPPFARHRRDERSPGHRALTRKRDGLEERSVRVDNSPKSLCGAEKTARQSPSVARVIAIVMRADETSPLDKEMATLSSAWDAGAPPTPITPT
jgi:hypothetical protein